MSQRKNLEKAIKACAGDRLVAFEEAVHGMIASKLLTAIERRKPAVAERLFSFDNKKKVV